MQASEYSLQYKTDRSILKIDSISSSSSSLVDTSKIQSLYLTVISLYDSFRSVTPLDLITASKHLLFNPDTLSVLNITDTVSSSLFSTLINFVLIFLAISLTRVFSMSFIVLSQSGLEGLYFLYFLIVSL